MATVLIENLTKQQATELAQWFSEQGEQDCLPWFEERNVPSPLVEEIEDVPGGDVIIRCSDASI